MEQKDRIYLNVPFDHKDHAKALGARWDADRKLWYCSKEHLKMHKKLSVWLPSGQGWKEPDVAINPSSEMLRRLIQLCHPDRHNASQASLLATQYLIGLKSGR